MVLRPSTLHEANAYVAAWHRHSRPVRGCRFCLAAVESGQVVGVAIVGRPLARALQRPEVAEILRVATNGHPNACSFLYGACRKAWQAMGGQVLLTYTLASESGSSLRGAAFRRVAELGPRPNWDTPSLRRPRSTEPCPARVRWEAV